MSLFIAGETRSPVRKLRAAIDECVAEWGDNPAYGDTASKLREIGPELDAMVQSPGAREATRVAEQDFPA